MQFLFFAIIYLEGKLARVVVHPTGMHQRQHVPDRRGLENLLSRDGADATVRQSRGHHRNTFRGHLHGTALRTQGIEYVGNYDNVLGNPFSS